MPTEAAQLASAQRSKRVWSNGELCVVDDRNFYLYGSIEIKIHEHVDSFMWGAWAKINEASFFRYQSSFNDATREKFDPLDAHLGTDIPFYPMSLGLPMRVHIQPVGTRPLFLLEQGAHPLVVDQQKGVSAARIEEIKKWFASLSA
jgi:hypothetical protein